MHKQFSKSPRRTLSKSCRGSTSGTYHLLTLAESISKLMLGGVLRIVGAEVHPGACTKFTSRKSVLSPLHRTTGCYRQPRLATLQTDSHIWQ